MGSELRDQYRDRLPTFKRLEEEVRFSVEAALRNRHIKVHAIQSRVKTLDSFIEKVERKEYADAFNDVPDIVGIRIVCLFLSDLRKIGDALRDVFEVTSEENKIENEDVASFGYMSIHYICQLGDANSGPRYNSIKDLQFEVQVRTIVMDAWANVSHHLDYKGEASIPRQLRRDFHALSGLFYVADQHFELFVREAADAERDAIRDVANENLDDVDLNVETLTAYLRARYPDRNSTTKMVMSEFVEALALTGFKTIGSLDAAMREAEPISLAFEKDRSERNKNYRLTAVGMVNVGIRQLYPEYSENRRRIQSERVGRDKHDQ